MSSVRLITKNIAQLTHNRGYGYSNRLNSDQRCTTVPTRHNLNIMSTMRRDTGKYPNRGCDIIPCITQLTTVHHSWIIITPSTTRGMDSPATPVGLSPPLLSLVLRNEPCYTKDKAVAHAGLWLAR